MLTLLAALASGGVAAGLTTYVIVARAHARWHASSNAYARRMANTCVEMLVPVDVAVARRLLLGTTIGGALLGWLPGDLAWQRAALAVAGALGGYHAPAMLLRLYARHRRMRIDDQFGPALVMMASGLQAGLSLPQALELTVRESPSPLADELALVVKEIHLGTRFDDAVQALPRRLPLEDVRMAVDAILTLRRSGGDLVTSFRVIADTIAERKKIEGRIRVITAEGMLQGIVMCLIPPAMLLLFFLMDPQSVRPLVGHPIGWAILGIVAALNTMGFLLMRKVAKVKV